MKAMDKHFNISTFVTSSKNKIPRLELVALPKIYAFNKIPEVLYTSR